MRTYQLQGLGACYNPMNGLGATDSNCPCEVTEVTENKTVTIPVKSQKIICKPTTVREGVVDCETIQRALGQGSNSNANTNTNNAQTNTNNAGANLLGMGNLDLGFNLDLMSVGVGVLGAWLVMKVL